MNKECSVLRVPCNHHAQTERQRKFDCFLFKITVTWNGIVFAFPFFFFAARRPRRYGCPCSCFFGVFLFFLLLLLLVGAACSAPGCRWKQNQKRSSSIHRLDVRGVASPVRYQLSWRPRQFLNLASTGLIFVVVVIIFLLDEWCEWYVFDKRRYILRQLQYQYWRGGWGQFHSFPAACCVISIRMTTKGGKEERMVPFRNKWKCS